MVTQKADVRVKDIERVRAVVVTTDASANVAFSMISMPPDDDSPFLAQEWLTSTSPEEARAQERSEWLAESLAGLERWEAKHGLGQGDDV